MLLYIQVFILTELYPLEDIWLFNFTLLENNMVILYSIFIRCFKYKIPLLKHRFFECCAAAVFSRETEDV